MCFCRTEAINNSHLLLTLFRFLSLHGSHTFNRWKWFPVIFNGDSTHTEVCLSPCLSVFCLSQSFLYFTHSVPFVIISTPPPPLISEKCTDVQSEGLTKDECRDDRVCGFCLCFDSFLWQKQQRSTPVKWQKGEVVNSHSSDWQSATVCECDSDKTTGFIVKYQPQSAVNWLSCMTVCVHDSNNEPFNLWDSTSSI